MVLTAKGGSSLCPSAKYACTPARATRIMKKCMSVLWRMAHAERLICAIDRFLHLLSFKKDLDARRHDAVPF